MMGADSDGVVGKVKETIGSVLGGSTGNGGLVDEHPDIEYPEPLDLVQTDDGHLVMARESLDDEQQEKLKTGSAAASEGASEDTRDTAESLD